MHNSKVILLIDNNPEYLEVLTRLLEFQGYKVLTSSTPFDAEKVIQNSIVHLIVTDLRALDDTDFNDKSGLIFARTVARTIPKIIMTAYASYDAAVEALKSDEIGSPPAIEFISKSEGLDVLFEAIERAFKKYVRFDLSQVKTGGALTAKEGANYAERDAEQKALLHLKRMDYLLVIEPRQQGKTSLINYLMRHSELNDFSFIYIDTTTPDHTSELGWYKTLCGRIVDQLQRIYTSAKWPDIPQNSFEWRQFLSALAKFIKLQEKYLVMALDEIGAIRFPESANFFSVLRDIYNARQSEPEFSHLTFVLVGTFHPRDLIDNEKISPFNISQRIRLNDFTQTQVNQLISRFSWTEEQSFSISERIHYWTNGQPYLTQQLSRNLRPGSTPIDIDNAIDALCREDENHIPPLLKKVANNDNLRTYLRQIHDGEKIIYYPLANQTQSQLEILGLIKADEDGYCIIRNRIYQRVLHIFETISSSDSKQRIQSPEIDMDIPDLAELHRLITSHFDNDELQTLCFSLGVNYDDLRGSAKVSKVRELISYLERRNLITTIIRKFRELRPGISTESIYRKNSNSS